MFSKQFWKEAAERSARTFAQTLISVIGVGSFSVWSLDWKNALGIALGAAFISVLMTLDRTAAIGSAAPASLTVVEVEKPTVVEAAPIGHGYSESLR